VVNIESKACLADNEPAAALAGHPTEPFDETFGDNGTANVLVAAS
jgi:hypothetical protein